MRGQFTISADTPFNLALELIDNSGITNVVEITNDWDEYHGLRRFEADCDAFTTPNTEWDALLFAGSAESGCRFLMWERRKSTAVRLSFLPQGHHNIPYDPNPSD